MFSPLFSFAFGPNFAVPFPTADNDPSPGQQPHAVPAIQTTIPDVDVTVLRPVFNPDSAANARLPNPGTARANTAPSVESPAGTPGWAQAHAHQTVFQQCSAFFDADADGVVWPHDTFRGLRTLGFRLPACVAGTHARHARAVLVPDAVRGAAARPARPHLVWLARVHRRKH